MANSPVREMRFFANRDSGIIEIVLLADGHPLGSIAYTQEQAESFAVQLVHAINEVHKAKSAGKPGLILTDKSPGLALN